MRRSAGCVKSLRRRALPRYPAGMTRAGWQIVKRADGWWLQQLQPSSGAWTDYSGPYRQRGSALAKYRRMELYYLMDVRHDVNHVHTFPAPGTVAPAWERYCTECGLLIEPQDNKPT